MTQVWSSVRLYQNFLTFCKVRNGHISATRTKHDKGAKNPSHMQSVHNPAQSMRQKLQKSNGLSRSGGPAPLVVKLYLATWLWRGHRLSRWINISCPERLRFNILANWCTQLPANSCCCCCWDLGWTVLWNVYFCVCSHPSGNRTSKHEVQSQVQEKTEMRQLFEILCPLPPPNLVSFLTFGKDWEVQWPKLDDYVLKFANPGFKSNLGHCERII